MYLNAFCLWHFLPSVDYGLSLFGMLLKFDLVGSGWICIRVRLPEAVSVFGFEFVSASVPYIIINGALGYQ